MEEPAKGSPASDDRSQKTAAALRALREGLGSKLETHRRRTSDMEADLTSHAQEIADELAHDQPAGSQAGGLPQEDQIRKLHDAIAQRDASVAKLQRQLSDAELHQLRLSAELTDSRSAIGAAKGKECASCGSLRTELTHAHEDTAALEARVEELLNVVSRAQEALVELRNAESTECAQLHAQVGDLQSQIEAATTKAVQLESQVESLTRELAESRESEQKIRDQHNVDNAAQIKVQLAVAQAQQQLTERTAELAAVTERESQSSIRIEELLAEVERLSEELSDNRDAQSELSAQASAQEAKLAESLGAAAEVKRLLDEQAVELAERAERESHAQTQIGELQAQIDTLTEDLQRAREAETQFALQQSENDSALSELQQALAAAQQAFEERTTEISDVSDRESRANSRIEELVAEIEELTRELNAVRTAEAELQAVHSADDTALTESRRDAEEARRQLDDVSAELAIAKERETAVNSRVETLANQVESLTADLTAAREAESKLLAERAASNAALAESEGTVAESQQHLKELKEQLGAAKERESQAGDRLDALTGQVESLTEQLTAAQVVETDLRKELSVDDAAHAEARAAADETEQALKAEVADLVLERETLAEDLAAAQAELAARAESATNEVLWLQKEREAAEQRRDQLAADFEELLKQHKASAEALAEAQSRTEQTAAALQQAEGQIATLSSSAEDELSQAQKKFELALADAQKLKRENAELQEELARRPEVAETESPELVSLRAERDVLAARIAELESAPPATVDEDSEQRLADLQRRFEMAVEDLRHFKQENALLQDKLAHSPKLAAGNTGSQAMDWQSQKARLLAALESEEAEDSPTIERREELVTIEGTISITDRVVADKDREIAELREQLSERPSEVVEQSPASEVLDKNELIAAERAKLEALQKEWHEKLRAAELEMSVQRATLARREVEIEQKVQAAQEAQSDPVIGADGKPRRRWLSALGLRDDEEGKK